MCSEQQLERFERRQNLVSLDHLVTYTLVRNVLLLLYSCVFFLSEELGCAVNNN